MLMGPQRLLISPAQSSVSSSETNVEKEEFWLKRLLPFDLMFDTFFYE